MLNDRFYEAWLIIGLVAFSYMFKGMYLIVIPGLFYSRNLGLVTRVEWLAAAINVGLNFILIPFYGIYGAALATFFAYLSLPITGWLSSRKYLKVPLSGDLFIIFLFFIMLVLGIVALQASVSDFMTKIASGIFVVLLYGSVVWKVFLYKGERDSVASFFKKT
nr:polysaccharide biosynthesis C-terminal domain-containing protein [Marinobacterium sp. xm-d-530]